MTADDWQRLGIEPYGIREGGSVSPDAREALRKIDRRIREGKDLSFTEGIVWGCRDEFPRWENEVEK